MGLRHFAAAVIWLAALLTVAVAEDWPARPLRIVVPFPAGGSADVQSRVIADGYPGTIHPWWRERYDDADLFTQLALVAGPVR